MLVPRLNDCEGAQDILIYDLRHTNTGNRNYLIPDLKTIKQLLEEAIAVGSSTVLKELRPKSDALSRKKAELEFGEARIRELLEANLISLRKIGARYYLSRVEINQALCQSSIQLLYIKTQDGQQPTSDKRRVGRILGNRRRTRKT